MNIFILLSILPLFFIASTTSASSKRELWLDSMIKDKAASGDKGAIVMLESYTYNLKDLSVEDDAVSIQF